MPKILLADCDRIFLEQGRTFLRKTGVELLSCLNGEDVLDIIRKENPELVIMSSNMSMKNGLECLKEVNNSVRRKSTEKPSLDPFDRQQI